MLRGFCRGLGIVRAAPYHHRCGGEVAEPLALAGDAYADQSDKIEHQPINEPIESDLTRSEVLRYFGAGGEQPLMMVRLGHAKSPPASVRRSVAVVASFRNS